MLMGRVDELNNSKVYGWAFNSESPTEHLVIRIMQGPRVIASGVANVTRPDLPDAGIGEGDHAFEIPVPPNIESFVGLMVIAQSQKEGEIALPIASNDDRRLDDLFMAFSQQYEDALVAMKEELDTLRERVGATGKASARVAGELPTDLDERLTKLESRMEAAEIFFVRIDEAVHKLVEMQKKKTRKRIFGIF